MTSHYLLISLSQTIEIIEASVNVLFISDSLLWESVLKSSHTVNIGEMYVIPLTMHTSTKNELSVPYHTRFPRN